MKTTILKNNERLDDLQINNKFVIQNPNEYCFTSDSVLLSNFAKCKRDNRVVDLCSGSGVVGILIQTKTNAKDVVCVELQPQLADMAKRSIEYNNQQNEMHVVNAPVQDVNKLIGVGYDVVVCNPPYKDAGKGKVSEKENIRIAKHEVKITLEEIIKEASTLLKFGGKFYVVNKEERLTDILVYCRKYRLEPKKIKLVSGGKGVSVVLVEAKKGGNSGVRIIT